MEGLHWLDESIRSDCMAVLELVEKDSELFCHNRKKNTSYVKKYAKWCIVSIRVALMRFSIRIVNDQLAKQSSHCRALAVLSVLRSMESLRRMEIRHMKTVSLPSLPLSTPLSSSAVALIAELAATAAYLNEPRLVFALKLRMQLCAYCLVQVPSMI